MNLIHKLEWIQYFTVITEIDMFLMEECEEKKHFNLPSKFISVEITYTLAVMHVKMRNIAPLNKIIYTF